MDKLSIGVDIGGTSVKLGIFNIEGQLIKKWEIRTNKENGANAVLKDIADTIRQNLQSLDYSLKDCIGVGMGVPGAVLPNSYVKVCVNLFWKDLYPAKILSEYLDNLPVVLNNDANIAALGECWQGGAKGYSDVVLITLGTGVGGGIVVNGKILEGKHGIAGEIGHIHIKYDEFDTCNCGAKGCLEQIASATGIVKEAKKQIKNKPNKNSKLYNLVDNLSAKDVLDLAKENDELAIEIMQEVCKYLGIAISNLAMTIDPQVFVIGGGVSKAGDFLINMIDKYFEKYMSLSEDRAKIVLAKLGNDAGIYGAAKLILHNYRR